MSNAQKVKISQLSRKQQPSKYKPGDTYAITKIKIEDDSDDRTLTGIGKWTDNWQIGDEINVLIEKGSWKDKDGFDKVQWNLKDPNAKLFTGGGGYGAANAWGNAYLAAAFLLPHIVPKTKLKIDTLDEVAKKIKDKIDNASKTDAPKPETKKEETTIDIDKEDKDLSKIEAEDSIEEDLF